MRKRARTVYVAMSGGVDSSVAAALLKERGFRVVGVFMKPWQPAGTVCQWRGDRADALRVASVLGIPLLTWDFSRQYGEMVARPLVRGYRSGITPNPDVECNRHIKFGLFAERAFREGADFIATGHYARIVSGAGRAGEARGKRQRTAVARLPGHKPRTLFIARARDRNKDQTYFLWGVPSGVLSRTLFPIGDLEKPRVRALARRMKLAVAGKKDSQGVCFVGPLDFRSFLARRIRGSRGVIRSRDGRVVGQHDGAAYFTIGQRHGLGLAGGSGPWYVVSKDMALNEIVVGSPADLERTRARLVRPRWFGGRPMPTERISVSIRYRSRPCPATISSSGIIRFRRPVRAVAPGQSAVVYRGNRLIGGGILA